MVCADLPYVLLSRQELLYHRETFQCVQSGTHVFKSRGILCVNRGLLTWRFTTLNVCLKFSDKLGDGRVMMRRCDLSTTRSYSVVLH